MQMRSMLIGHIFHIFLYPLYTRATSRLGKSRIPRPEAGLSRNSCLQHLNFLVKMAASSVTRLARLQYVEVRTPLTP